MTPSAVAKLVESWPHDVEKILDGKADVHLSSCKRCQLEAALAAHDQKVRAEGQDDVLNELSAELAQDLREDLIKRGQRPAPAASKPEAGKGGEK